jgi:RNA polymerase sigma-70 factor (ECF subfamily)
MYWSTHSQAAWRQTGFCAHFTVFIRLPKCMPLCYLPLTGRQLGANLSQGRTTWYADDSLVDIVEKALNGDIQAEKQLYEQLFESFKLIVTRRLYWASREEVEDVAQDACRTILEKYKDETFTDGFAQWSYGVLSNKIGNAIKKRRRNRVNESDLSEHPQMAASVNPNPRLRQVLLDCFRKLVRIQKQYARLINLSYQGYQTAEICARMSISPSNCYSTLHRARGRLLACLEENGVAL